MPKQKQEEQTAVVVIENTNSAMAVATDVDRSDRRGKENIEQGDLTLPRIAIAQALSKVLDESKAEYSEKVKKYDLYNTVSGESYGRGPITFAIVRMDKRAMQTDADGNIVEFDVKWDDPKCEFTTGPNGERLKPVATRIYDYIVVLPETMELAVLSLSKMATKAAKKLNAFQQLRPGAAWSGLYTATTIVDTKANFTFGNYVIKPAGATPPDVAEFAAGVYESLKGQTVATDRSDVIETVASDDDM